MGCLLEVDDLNYKTLSRYMILHGIYFLTNKSTWQEKPKFSKCEQSLCQHQLAKAKLKTKTN